jgi:transposase
MPSGGIQVVGIDIAKDTFSLGLDRGESERGAGVNPPPFVNTEQGYQHAVQWLSPYTGDPSTCQIVLEATGVYWEACALFFHQKGYKVSVVNPAQVRAFSRTLLRRGKTDEMDADLLARFGRMVQPKVWTPPPLDMQHLHQIMRHREAYVRMRTEEKNRLHALQHRAQAAEEVLQACSTTIAFLDQQIAALEQAFKTHLEDHPAWKKNLDILTSIGGVGLVTAGILMTETNNFATFVDPKQVAAYAGISPMPFQSGTSVHRRPKMSKIGNAHLRKAVYMAAVSAIRTPGVFKAFYHRLRDKGKPAKVALVAVARKLLGLAFTLIQKQQFFDPAYVSVKPA